jgi:hypothetical protein
VYIYIVQWHNTAYCYRSLVVGIIERAIDDLKETDPLCRRIDKDRAMYFILSDTCEAYCLELGIDYKTVREKAAALYRETIAKEDKPFPGVLFDDKKQPENMPAGLMNEGRKTGQPAFNKRFSLIPRSRLSPPPGLQQRTGKRQ